MHFEKVESALNGVEGLTPPAPELVRVKKGDPNHAAKFDYALASPNSFAGVDTKKILRNLTAVKLIAFCDDRQTNKQGMVVVVDNVVFEK